MEADPPAAEPSRRVAPRSAITTEWLDRNRLARIEADASPGALEDAPVAVRRRWTDRTVVELILLMTSFVSPYLAIHYATSGPLRTAFLPLAGVVSSLLILGIGASAPSFMFGGLRAARRRFWLEAVAVGLSMAGLALLWVTFVIDRGEPARASDFREFVRMVGVPMAFFTIAFCPAIFEELAFRGLVQGRLQALFGTVQGRLMASAAFALAHGLTPAFPLHATLALYLGWLRDRSHSLLPGMALHFVYNATLVGAEI